MTPDVAKVVIVFGMVIVLLGLIGYFYGNVFGWFGNLPGDIRYEREGISFFLPITSMILISLVLSLLFRILK